MYDSFRRKLLARGSNSGGPYGSARKRGAAEGSVAGGSAGESSGVAAGFEVLVDRGDTWMVSSTLLLGGALSLN